MTIIIRIGIALLFLAEFVVGAWNVISPETFYTNLPTVDLTPPFSEHYARDFGGTTLGTGLLLGIALVKPKAHFAIPALLAYSVFAIPHFFYHLNNMENATVGQAILLTVGNAFVALLGIFLILLTIVRDRRAKRSADLPDPAPVSY